MLLAVFIQNITDCSIFPIAGYLEQQKDNMTAGRDLEKGLEIARSILNGSNDNEHQNVLLLLHVYILPIIRLHASDRKHVSSALVDQVRNAFRSR